MKNLILLLTILSTLPLLNYEYAIADEGSEEFENVHEERNFRRGRRRQRVQNEESERSNEIRMGRIRLRGNGCPSGTAAVSMSPDNRAVSILFDEFSIEVGGELGVRRDVKRCRVVVPLDVPAGMQVAVVALDYRGYNYLPNRAKTVLKTAHFFAHRQEGVRQVRKVVRKIKFQGPLDDEFFVSSEMNSGLIWSECGRRVRMGFVTRLMTKTNPQLEEALSFVDTIDAIISPSEPGERLTYHLFWRRC